VRFFKGPSLPDRVISLDVFSANLLAVLAIYSVLSEEKAYLNVALIMSLIAFVGTMTFAYYLVQKREKSKNYDQ
jgi:multicomponent Na+:H+ antiporter subunit F